MTNFVLVDFENVQPKNLSLLCGGPFKIKVFVGASQVKIPLEIARALQAFGADAEYIQIDGNGSNALDFHIAYYMGRLAAETPDSSFHIVSQDSGFDPLIRHLKARGISCERLKSIADIEAVKITNSRSIPEKIDAVIDNLAKRKTGKPRTLKTLSSTIKALFSNQVADEEIDELVEELTKRGTIKISGGKVHYEPQS